MQTSMLRQRLMPLPKKCTKCLECVFLYYRLIASPTEKCTWLSKTVNKLYFICFAKSFQ